MRMAFILTIMMGVSAMPAAVMAQIAQQDGSVSIGGRKMRCSGMPVHLSSDLPIEGMAVPGEGVYLNPQLLARHPGQVRMFVFKHECAHKTVGGNEHAADCSAVRAGVREGWLTASGVASVCKSLAGTPASATHPSGTSRCANIKRCFGGGTATAARRTSKASASAALSSRPLQRSKKK